jgi:hypothetical protein
VVLLAKCWDSCRLFSDLSVPDLNGRIFSERTYPSKIVVYTIVLGGAPFSLLTLRCKKKRKGKVNMGRQV